MIGMPSRHILSASIRGVIILTIADAVTAVCASVVGVSVYDVFGDLLILEAAICLLFGGLLDFSKSAGLAQLRRLLSGEVELASQTSPRTTHGSSVALMFFVMGILMLLGTILLTIVDVSLRHLS